MNGTSGTGRRCVTVFLTSCASENPEPLGLHTYHTQRVFCTVARCSRLANPPRSISTTWGQAEQASDADSSATSLRSQQ